MFIALTDWTCRAHPGNNGKLEDGLIAAGCKKAISCFLQQGAATEFRMSVSIRAKINFCMHRAEAAEFNRRRCPINISKPVMWVPDPTYSWLFVNRYQLFVNGTGTSGSEFRIWGVRFQRTDVNDRRQQLKTGR